MMLKLSQNSKRGMDLVNFLHKVTVNMIRVASSLMIKSRHTVMRVKKLKSKPKKLLRNRLKKNFRKQKRMPIKRLKKNYKKQK